MPLNYHSSKAYEISCHSIERQASWEDLRDGRDFCFLAYYRIAYQVMFMSYETTIRFQHVDNAGILYFSRAFELCHEALEDILIAAGYPLEEILREGDWVMPIVHAESDYRKPMCLGDKIVISAEVETGGGSSLTFRYAMKNSEGVVHAEVKLVHVVLDRKTFKAQKIPPVFLKAIEGLGLFGDQED